LMVGHFSDTHLGLYSREEAVKERENDYYEAFREAIELFIKEHVDVVIHSGDILHEPRPLGKAVINLVEMARELFRRDIPFLFTLGEHDISSIPSTPYPILLERLGIGLFIGDGEPREVKRLRVVGLSKHKRAQRNELLINLDRIGGEQRNYRGKSILVLHQDLRDLSGPWAELSLVELPEGFHYYAMGHLHRHVEMRRGDGLLSYPGPTHWVDVNDPDECGVNIVDLSGDQPTVQWARLENVRPKKRMRAREEELNHIIDELLKEEHRRRPCLWLEVEADRFRPNPSLIDRLGEKYIVQKVTILSTKRATKTYQGLQENSIDTELRRLALEALGGDERSARFALADLLPLLSDPNRKEEAIKVAWDYYRGGRWDDKKD